MIIILVLRHLCAEQCNKLKNTAEIHFADLWEIQQRLREDAMFFLLFVIVGLYQAEPKRQCLEVSIVKDMRLQLIVGQSLIDEEPLNSVKLEAWHEYIFAPVDRCLKTIFHIRRIDRQFTEAMRQGLNVLCGHGQ